MSLRPRAVPSDRMSDAGRRETDAAGDVADQDSVAVMKGAASDVVEKMGACAVSTPPCNALVQPQPQPQPQQLAVGPIDRQSPQRKIVKNVQSVIPRNR